MKARWMLVATTGLVASCGSDVMVNGPEGDAIVIRAHLAPDESCALDVDGRVLSQGRFDIAEGWTGSRACANGYDLNLLVDNGRSENVVFESAEVRIATVNDQAILFPETDPPLPNPLTTVLLAPISTEGSAVVTAEVIPASYAPFLTDFVDGKIKVSVQLRGTTDSGAKVSSREQPFSVEICDGCLTACYTRVVSSEDEGGLGMTVEDVYGRQCPDDAGADGRVCVDLGC